MADGREKQLTRQVRLLSSEARNEAKGNQRLQNGRVSVVCAKLTERHFSYCRVQGATCFPLHLCHFIFFNFVFVLFLRLNLVKF